MYFLYARIPMCIWKYPFFFLIKSGLNHMYNSMSCSVHSALCKKLSHIPEHSFWKFVSGCTGLQLVHQDREKRNGRCLLQNSPGLGPALCDPTAQRWAWRALRIPSWQPGMDVSVHSTARPRALWSPGHPSSAEGLLLFSVESAMFCLR